MVAGFSPSFFPLTAIATGIFTGGKQRKLSDSEEIGSAFIGGVLSGFICAPMELVMIQQQRKGGTLLDTTLACDASAQTASARRATPRALPRRHDECVRPPMPLALPKPHL